MLKRKREKHNSGKCIKTILIMKRQRRRKKFSGFEIKRELIYPARTPRIIITKPKNIFCKLKKEKRRGFILLT